MPGRAGTGAGTAASPGHDGWGASFWAQGICGPASRQVGSRAGGMYVGPKHLRQGLSTAKQVTKPGFSEQVQAGDPEVEETYRYRGPPESGGCTSSQASAPKDSQPLAGHQINSEHSSSHPTWSPPHSPALRTDSTQPSNQKESGRSPLSLYYVHMVSQPVIDIKN